MNYQLAKKIFDAEPYLGDYLSWIAYKNAFNVVRYYPTFRMFEMYVNTAKAHGLNYFYENVDIEKAHQELCLYLKYRLQFLDN